MKKEELIERIVDTFTGMGSEDPIDTAFCNYLTLEEAKTYLDEYRAMEKADFEPDEWLPEEVTPELWMEANNCYIRKCKYDVTVLRIAKWLVDTEPVCLYDDYHVDYNSESPSIESIDYWYNFDDVSFFPFGYGKNLNPFDVIELIQIGINSKDTCNFTDNFILYDSKNKVLQTCNKPFGEGIINAMDFAKYIMGTPDVLDEARTIYMSQREEEYIFEMEDQ